MPLPYTVFTQTIMHLVYLAGSGGDTQDFKWREIEWGQKLKPKRIPAPKINPQKMPCQISEPLEFPEGIKWYNTKAKNIRKWMFVPLFLRTAKSEVIIRGHKSSDCFEYQKNPYLNQVTPIFLQKNTGIEISNPKILLSFPSPEIRSTTLSPGLFSCQKNLHNHCLVFLVGEIGNNGRAKF